MTFSFDPCTSRILPYESAKVTLYRKGWNETECDEDADILDERSVRVEENSTLTYKSSEGEFLAIFIRWSLL